MDQILWQNRKSYIDLLEKYLRSEINAQEVVDSLFELHLNHVNESEDLAADPERLKKIQIVSESEEFWELIEDIFAGCVALDLEETDDTSGYPISENTFRKEMSVCLQEMKDYD